MNEWLLRMTLTTCLFLFSLANLLTACLLLYKIHARLTARWRRRRKRFYEEILKNLLQNLPGNHHEQLEPCLWGDAGVVEALLIERLAQIKGPLREELIRVAESSGLVRRRFKQLNPKLNPYRLASLIEKCGLLSSVLSVPYLLPYLSHPNAEVRFVTGRSLCRIGDPRALRPLVRMVLTQPPNEAPRLVGFFAQFGRWSVPYLWPLLHNDDPMRRWMAVTTLGEIRDRFPATLLGLLLKNDPDQNVRKAAALALGQLGASAWSVELIEALHDPSESVRAAAAMVLGRLPDLRSIPAIEQALEDPQPAVRREAARALANLGPLGKAVLKQHDFHADEELQMLVEPMAVA